VSCHVMGLKSCPSFRLCSEVFNVIFGNRFVPVQNDAVIKCRTSLRENVGVHMVVKLVLSFDERGGLVVLGQTHSSVGPYGFATNGPDISFDHFNAVEISRRNKCQTNDQTAYQRLKHVCVILIH
jgi:hypothetical protein